MIVTVESAVEMSEHQALQLKSKLESNLNSKVELRIEVDKGLLGGLRIVLPNETIDMSLRAKLDQLSELLLGDQK